MENHLPHSLAFPTSAVGHPGLPWRRIPWTGHTAPVEGRDLMGVFLQSEEESASNAEQYLDHYLVLMCLPTC